MLTTSSPIVLGILKRVASDLPLGWWDHATDLPSSIAREEMAWACLARVVDHILFRDPLPSEIRVGRELVTVSIPSTEWVAIQEELGMNNPGSRHIIANLISMIVHRAKIGPPLVGPAAPMVLGLALLLSDLARRSRQNRRPGGLTSSFAPEEPLRNSVKSISGAAWNEHALVEDLLHWAGVPRVSVSDAFRTAYHVIWLPLSRRVTAEPLNPALESPLVLPANFLHRAISQPIESSPPAEALKLSGTIPQGSGVQRAVPNAPACPQAPSEFDLERLIQVLAEPFLAMRGDPCEAIDAGLRGGSPLGEDILRAWRRLFLSGDMETYGEIGSKMRLTLPDRAWRIDAGPFANKSKGSHGWFRVTRRGLRYRGFVMVAGLVVVAEAPEDRHD